MPNSAVNSLVLLIGTGLSTGPFSDVPMNAAVVAGVPVMGPGSLLIVVVDIVFAGVFVWKISPAAVIGSHAAQKTIMHARSPLCSNKRFLAPRSVDQPLFFMRAPSLKKLMPELITGIDNAYI